MSAPVDTFAEHLATLESPIAVERALKQARMLAAGLVPDDKLVPELLSGDALAAQSSMRLEAAEGILRELGYAGHLLRLLDRDDNAAACRRAAVAKLTADIAVSDETAENLVLSVASGIRTDSDVIDLLGEAEPARFLIPGRWYEGKFHLLFGKEGTNKTTLMLHDACELATQGKHSILFEYEMDRSAVMQMIDDLGFDREAVAKYVHVVTPREQFSSGLLMRFLGRWPDAQLVVLDNVSEAIASGGDQSENDAGDVVRTLGMMRNVAHDRGIACVALDHLPHHRTDAARGSTAKAQIMDVAFSIEAMPPVRRDSPGKLKLTCRKDRPSLIGKGAETWLSIGDGAGGLPIRELDRAEDAGSWSDLQVGMLEELRKHHEATGGEDIGVTALLALVGVTSGRKFASAKAELVELHRDHTAPVNMTVVKRGNAPEQCRFAYVEGVAGVADDGTGALEL